MSTQALKQTLPEKKALIGGKAFDVYFMLSILWLYTGTFADSWAHNHVRRLETFFTPWHGVLYSGLAFFILCSLVTLLINRQRGASWKEAIPPGYNISFFGMIALVFVGFGDMTWHVLFGIEQNIDALFSPTHLSAMVCFGFISAGPLQAMYRRKQPLTTFGDKLLLALAVTTILIMIVNESQPSTIFSNLWPVNYPVGSETGQLAGILGFIFQGMLFTGFALYTMRRWTLFPGFFTFILTVIAIPMSLMQDHYIMILISFLAGVIIDAAYYFLKPSLSRPTEFRVFSVFAAASLYAVYMIVLELTTKVVWTVHMAVGSVFVVAVFGWLITYLVLPAQSPATDQEV